MENSGVEPFDIWVPQILPMLGVTRVYIAIIPNMQPKAHYDLEIETIPRDTIGAVYPLGNFSLEEARKHADLLEAELNKHGITVVKTRKEWEAA